MATIEKLHFTTNAKLGQLIGRELITNNIAAVFELIKNSYDAFATEVTIELKDFDIQEEDVKDLKKASKSDKRISNDQSAIIISDNGKGMTKKEIKDRWMVIGTTSKENIIREETVRKSKRIARIINGEKGIGRFGCDRLGAVLNMTSVGGNGEEKNRLTVNWDEFEKHDITLQEIEIEVQTEQLSEKEETGLMLEISHLRDVWTKKDLHTLYDQLQKLISPFKQEESDFSIFLKIGEYKEPIKNESLEYATSKIEGKVENNGLLQYTISDDLNSVTYTEQAKPPIFGPVNFKILYLDATAKRKFSMSNGMSTRELGNIKLFRDNFRILPYGEVENDWLGIDNEHAQSVFRTLGTRDIIGYFQISKEHNPNLKDATNRQGLNEDTREFLEFKVFIWSILRVFQKTVFAKIKEKAEKSGKAISTHAKEIEQGIKNARQQIATIPETEQTNEEGQTRDTVSEAAKYLDQVANDVQVVKRESAQMTQRLTVMENIVGTETFLYDMMHSIKNKLDTLNAYVESIKLQAESHGLDIDYEGFDFTVKAISTIVLSALNKTSPNRNNKQYVYLDDIIQHYIEEKQLVYPQITFEKVSLLHKKIYCNPNSVKDVFDNLLSNSKKAFVKDRAAKIRISMNVNGNGKPLVYFEDNGRGIEEENIPYIFNVSFTRTDGTGIGLSYCLQTMKELGGDIAYVREGNLGGATFVMTF